LYSIILRFISNFFGNSALGHHHTDRICPQANVHRFSISLAAISKLCVPELRHEDKVAQYKVYSLRPSGTRNLCTLDLETHQPSIQRVQEVGVRSVDLSILLRYFSKISRRAALQCLRVLLHIPAVLVFNLGPDTGYFESPCGLIHSLHSKVTIALKIRSRPLPHPYLYVCLL